MKPAGLTACIALCTSVLIYFSGVPDVTAGDHLVDFSLANLHDGKPFHSEENRSGGMILVFGSMYCKPCVQLLPVLNKLHAGSAETGVSVVGIDIDKRENTEKVKIFADRHSIEFPFLVDTLYVAKNNKIFMLPTTLVIRPDGKIKKRFVGYQSYNALFQEVKKLQKERGGCGRK